MPTTKVPGRYKIASTAVESPTGSNSWSCITSSAMATASSSSAPRCSSWPPPTPTVGPTAPTRAASPALPGARPVDARFPSYDGNGMFRSLGNAITAVNPDVGMLFIDFEHPNRMRVNGTATLHDEPELLAGWEGAQLVVKVEATKIFPNCPRYIHRMQLVEHSVYAPPPRPRSAGARVEADGCVQGLPPPGTLMTHRLLTPGGSPTWPPPILIARRSRAVRSGWRAAAAESAANRLARPGRRAAWPGRHGHDRAAQLGRVVRRRGRGVEDRSRPAAGVSQAAGPRDGRHRRAGRTPPSSSAWMPTRSPGAAASRSAISPGRRHRRRPVARRRVTGVEGADIGRLDRATEADRVRATRRSWTPMRLRRCCSRPTAAW